MPPQYPNFTIEEAFEAAGPPPGVAPYGWAHFHEGEPPVGFFTNPPKDARAIFSTARGTKLFRAVNKPTQERQGYYWWAAQIQLTCDEIRRNFFSECKYLQQPRDYWDLYQYFDAHDIYYRGAQNLWSVINHLVYENTIVLADLLKNALPMIESWAVKVLASERAMDKLRSWNSETHKDIMTVFDDDELKDIEGMETFYLDHIRTIFFKCRLDLLSGRPISFAQHLKNTPPPSISGESLATDKQQHRRHHLPVENDRCSNAGSIETGSKDIDGVVIVDGTSASATRMDAYKKAKRAQKGRTSHHSATGEQQVDDSEPDTSTNSPSIVAKDARTRPTYNSMGIGLGRPQTASAPPTEGRYTSAPTFGTQSTMESSEVPSDITQARIYPGDQHEVGEKVKGCLKPDGPIMSTIEKGSSNSSDISLIKHHQNNPVISAGKSRAAVPAPSIEDKAYPTNTGPITETSNVFGQTMRPFYQTTANHPVPSLIQKHVPVSFEQQHPGMRSRNNTYVQVPQMIPYSQLPPRVPGSFRRDTLGSTAFANQIPQLSPHGPCPNTSILGHNTGSLFAPPQPQVFGCGQGIASTGNFRGPPRSRGYSGSRNGSGMCWRANGTDPIHGPKVVFCKANTHSGQNYNPSHGPKDYHHRGHSYGKGNGNDSDSPGRSHKGSLTSNRRTSFGSNYSHHRMSSGRSHRYSNASSRYREPSAQSSGVNNNHDNKLWVPVQMGIPVYSSGPPCLNADKNFSMHVKYDPCPCPQCDERDRSVYVSHLHDNFFQQGRGVEILRDFFSQFGPIQEVVQTSRYGNAAIVKFTTFQSAILAVKNVHKPTVDRLGIGHFRVAFRTGSQFFEPLPHFHQGSNKHGFSRCATLPHETLQRMPPVSDSQGVPEGTGPLSMPTPILEEPSVSGTSAGLVRNVQKISQEAPGTETKLSTAMEPLGQVYTQVTNESMETKPPSDTVVASPNPMAAKSLTTPPRQIVNLGHDDTDGISCEHTMPSNDPEPEDRTNTTPIPLGSEEEEEIDYGTMIQRPGKARYMPLPMTWPAVSGPLPLVRDFAQEHPQNTSTINDQDYQNSSKSSREKGKTKERTELIGSQTEELDLMIQMLPSVAYIPSPATTPTSTVQPHSTRNDQPRKRSRSPSAPAKRKVEQPSGDTPEHGSPKKKVVQTWKEGEPQKRKNTNRRGANKKKNQQGQKRSGPLNFAKQHEGDHDTTTSHNPQLGISGSEDHPYSTDLFRPDITSSTLLSYPQTHENPGPSKPEPFPPYRDLMSGPYNDGKKHKRHGGSGRGKHLAALDNASMDIGGIPASSEDTKKLNTPAKEFVSSSNSSSVTNSPGTKFLEIATSAPLQANKGLAQGIGYPSSHNATKNQGAQKQKVAVPLQSHQGTQKRVPAKDGKAATDKPVTQETVNNTDTDTVQHSSKDEPKSITAKGKGKQGKKGKGKPDQATRNAGAEASSSKAETTTSTTTSTSTSTCMSTSNNNKLSKNNKQKGQQGTSKKSAALGGSMPTKDDTSDSNSNTNGNDSKASGSEPPTQLQQPRLMAGSGVASGTVPALTLEDWPELLSPSKIEEGSKACATAALAPHTSSTSTSTTTQTASFVRDTRAATDSSSSSSTKNKNKNKNKNKKNKKKDDDDSTGIGSSRRKATASPTPSTNSSSSSSSSSSSATLLPSTPSDDNNDDNGGDGGDGGGIGNYNNTSTRATTTTTTTTGAAPDKGKKKAKKATGGPGTGAGTSTKGPGPWKSVSAGREGKANPTGRERRPPDGERKGG